MFAAQFPHVVEPCTPSSCALKLLRPLNYYQFSQALQLFILYGVQLAIFPVAAMSEFLLYVVHDTINKRGRPWQFAQELITGVPLKGRRIEW